MHECVKQIACLWIANRRCFTFAALSAGAIQMVPRYKESLVQVCHRSEDRIGQHSDQQQSHGWEAEQSTKAVKHTVHISMTIRVNNAVTQSQPATHTSSINLEMFRVELVLCLQSTSV